MYRVIIVDDEIWSLIGLKKIIEGDSRFSVLYETTDSLDALVQISIRKPDIVITDVRMPELSGIELMHEVRERGIKSEFIVVSGFAEFSYVQQALREGAFDYQLKPFDKNALQEMLNKLYEKLEKKSSTSDLELYSLLRDKKNSAAELLEQSFGHSLYKYLQIVIVYYKHSDFKKIELETADDEQYFFLKIGPRKCMGIINSSREKAEEICERLRQMDGEIERAAISSVGDSAESFSRLLKEAENSTLDAFVYPEKKIFQYEEPRRDVVQHLEEVMDNLYVNHNFQKLGEVILGFGQVFQEQHMGAVDAVYLWNQFTMHFTQWYKEKQIEQEYLDIFELTERFADIQEMSNWLNMQLLRDKTEQWGVPSTINFLKCCGLSMKIMRKLSI